MAHAARPDGRRSHRRGSHRLPACCSCHRARQWLCTSLGHAQGDTKLPLLSRQMKHASPSMSALLRLLERVVLPLLLLLLLLLCTEASEPQLHSCSTM